MVPCAFQLHLFVAIHHQKVGKGTWFLLSASATLFLDRLPSAQWHK